MAVEQDGAGAAYAVLAAEMGAGEAQLLAHEVRQREPHLDLLVIGPAVDGEGNPTRLWHFPALPHALPVARP